MMKRIMAIGVTMAMLLAGNSARCEDCGIVNSSFEDDGTINDISVQAPTGWNVDLLGGKFYGFVYTGWATDGFYNLSLYLNKRVQYHPGDIGRVSLAEPIRLTGFNWIKFDVMLDTASGAWNPSVCTAVVMIDDDVVWESNSVGPDARGEYEDQVYVVEDKYKDDELHTLSLGMRMNVEAYYYLQWLYQTHWDMVDCNVYCGGEGPIEGDIDGDCCVDANDLKLLAGLWLSEGVEPNDPANLSDVGDDPNSYAIIDFRDFSVYAADWDGSEIGVQELVTYWLEVVDPDYEYNLYREGDIRARGEINFFDLAVLGRNWLRCSGSGEE